jgi:hypothetical protein
VLLSCAGFGCSRSACSLSDGILQFIGHYFEGKPPEFIKDWRFPCSSGFDGGSKRSSALAQTAPNDLKTEKVKTEFFSKNSC